MPFSITSFAVFLSIIWFLMYWILGGVFFAVIALLRLGRLKKVRFSCLFSLWALLLGVGASFVGLRYGESSIETCVAEAETRSEIVVAVFGCGFTAVFGTFLIGALVLLLGGFVILSLSRSKSKPWIVLEQEEEDESVEDEHFKESRYF